MSKNQTYTIQELAEAAKVTRQTIYNCIDKIYPDIRQNGVKTILSIDQAKNILSEVKKVVLVNQNQPVKNLQARDLDALFKNPDFFRKIAEVIEDNERQARALEAQRPKVEFFDNYMTTDQYYDMGDAARILGTGRTRLFRQLRAARILMADNIPYQEFMKYFKIVPVAIKNGTEYKNIPKISARGIEYLQRKFYQARGAIENQGPQLLKIS